ncbi:MAG: hypothetical protein LBB59_05450 [Campylobacteraceae bacterium]|jgi:hypothetical protein|nr:hypothetical protein [Campylobacteraceae bacterium]
MAAGIKKIMLILLISIAFLFSANTDLQDVHNSAEDITNSTILDWWGKYSNEKLDIFTKPMPFFSKNREKAFLIEAGIFNGRNDWHIIALIFPKIQEVKIVDKNIIRQDIKILDLDKDGISEVEGAVVYSGQGTQNGTKVILQFDNNFSISVLHSAAMEKSSGYYTKTDEKYYDKQVDWRYFDIDKDGISDLIRDSYKRRR